MQLLELDKPTTLAFIREFTGRSGEECLSVFVPALQAQCPSAIGRPDTVDAIFEDFSDWAWHSAKARNVARQPAAQFVTRGLRQSPHCR